LQNGKERLRNVCILDRSTPLCSWSLDSPAVWMKPQYYDMLLCI